MPQTGKTGKPTATFEVQIVQESEKQINMYLHNPGHELGPILFKADSGTSGPKAYDKLAKIIELEEARASKESEAG